MTLLRNSHVLNQSLHLSNKTFCKKRHNEAAVILTKWTQVLLRQLITQLC